MENSQGPPTREEMDVTIRVRGTPEDVAMLEWVNAMIEQIDALMPYAMAGLTPPADAPPPPPPAGPDRA
jgi:hypothetical protein